MCRAICIIILILFNFYHAFSQSESDGNNESFEKEKLNTFQIELLGKGYYYSLNYERAIYKYEKISLNFNVGTSLFPGYNSLSNSTELLFPTEINLGYHNGIHNIHFGFGTTFWRYYVNYIPIDNSNLSQQPIPVTSERQWELFSHLSLEYRINPKEKNMFYKIGYVPLFFAEIPNSSFDKKINYQTSFCLGIGYKF